MCSSQFVLYARHVSNKQMFIIRNSVETAYCILQRIFMKSSRWHDMNDISSKHVEDRLIQINY